MGSKDNGKGKTGNRTKDDGTGKNRSQCPNNCAPNGKCVANGCECNLTHTQLSGHHLLNFMLKALCSHSLRICFPIHPTIRVSAPTMRSFPWPFARPFARPSPVRPCNAPGGRAPALVAAGPRGRRPLAGGILGWHSSQNFDPKIIILDKILT